MSRRIIGESQPIKSLLNMISRVAPTKTNILIIGESGTGKELIARMIHDSGPLKGKAFVPVNCGAIPETLIESEMFGHKKGSFTGAVVEKAGLFEAANGGTLFLDEVGELPLTMQVKLLRAIQDHSFRKVGGTENVKVDVRIIAATNRDLEAAVLKGTFREDLFYRLNVIMIKAPPLRDRKDDIQILAKHFLKKFSEQNRKDMEGFDDEALSALSFFSWPGNVRELENVIERAVTLESGRRVTLATLPSEMVANYKKQKNVAAMVMPEKATVGTQHEAGSEKITLPAPMFDKGPINLDEILGEVEKVYLLAALKHAGGVKKKAATLLGITFRSIRYRLKKLGVESNNDLDEE